MYLEKIDITDQLPRAHGALHLKSTGTSKIRNLFQQGSTKALFPRKVNGLECVIINTSGGLTGGDKFSSIVECEDQGDSSEIALNNMLEHIWQDAVAICGIEMHRRVLSLAHNADFEEISDTKKRSQLEARNLMMGRD